MDLHRSKISEHKASSTGQNRHVLETKNAIKIPTHILPIIKYIYNYDNFSRWKVFVILPMSLSQVDYFTKRVTQKTSRMDQNKNISEANTNS